MNNDFNTKAFKYTVLVVDDEHINLQLVASILNPYYRLLLADKAENVLQVCIEKQPDLILLDIAMPGKSGFELTQDLKQDPKTRSIPIIFLTAKNEEEDIDLAFQLGGVDYILKPFKAKELLARVHTQIKLRSAEKRLRQAIDLVPHRFFAKDSSGNIILANAAAARFYSKEVDELLDHLEPPLPAGWIYVSNIDTKTDEKTGGEMLNYQEELYMPDGTRKYFQTSKTPFPFSAGQLPATLELAIDITSEREKKQEIINLNEELLKHSRFKDKLFSLIAHDLRIPVLNTDMTLSLLLKRIESLSKEEITERITRAKNSTDRTLKMLENLLEWSKTQFQAIRFNSLTLDLAEEIDKVKSSVLAQLELKPLELKTDLDEVLKIEADPEMFQTILRNLVSNAIKFSEEGDTVSITARADGKRVFISVTDTGIGIPKEYLNELQQGNLEHITSFGTKGEKGFGIGINLSKEFIERHGGQLEIESEEGKGSRFTFSVPAAAAA